MKGYFSKLAKQSGLRYAKGNTASPASDAKKNAAELAPLERDEIVLISPAATKNETFPAVENLSPQRNDSTAKISAAPAEKESLKPPALTEKSDAANPQSVSAANEQGETYVEAQPVEPEKRNSKTSIAAEQIIFKENETTEMIGAKSAETSNPQIFRPAEIRIEPNDKTVDIKSVQPEFFNKTAEILESGTADKLEIQQILFQEINEWVSAAPVRNETENAFETGKEIQTIASPTVRNTPDSREPAESPSKNSDNLQEQNFNLSIGTITVVVEEPENQTKIAAKNQSRVVGKTEPEKRGFSRLSRYYL